MSGRKRPNLSSSPSKKKKLNEEIASPASVQEFEEENEQDDDELFDILMERRMVQPEQVEEARVELVQRFGARFVRMLVAGAGVFRTAGQPVNSLLGLFNRVEEMMKKDKKTAKPKQFKNPYQNFIWDWFHSDIKITSDSQLTAPQEDLRLTQEEKFAEQQDDYIPEEVYEYILSQTLQPFSSLSTEAKANLPKIEAEDFRRHQKSPIQESIRTLERQIQSPSKRQTRRTRYGQTVLEMAMQNQEKRNEIQRIIADEPLDLPALYLTSITYQQEGNRLKLLIDDNRLRLLPGSLDQVPVIYRDPHVNTAQAMILLQRLGIGHDYLEAYDIAVRELHQEAAHSSDWDVLKSATDDYITNLTNIYRDIFVYQGLIKDQTIAYNIRVMFDTCMYREQAGQIPDMMWGIGSQMDEEEILQYTCDFLGWTSQRSDMLMQLTKTNDDNGRVYYDFFIMMFEFMRSFYNEMYTSHDAMEYHYYDRRLAFLVGNVYSADYLPFQDRFPAELDGEAYFQRRKNDQLAGFHQVFLIVVIEQLIRKVMTEFIPSRGSQHQLFRLHNALTYPMAIHTRVFYDDTQNVNMRYENSTPLLWPVVWRAILISNLMATRLTLPHRMTFTAGMTLPRHLAQRPLTSDTVVRQGERWFTVRAFGHQYNCVTFKYNRGFLTNHEDINQGYDASSGEHRSLRGLERQGIRVPEEEHSTHWTQQLYAELPNKDDIQKTIIEHANELYNIYMQNKQYLTNVDLREYDVFIASTLTTHRIINYADYKQLVLDRLTEEEKAQLPALDSYLHDEEAQRKFPHIVKYIIPENDKELLKWRLANAPFSETEIQEYALQNSVIIKPERHDVQLKFRGFPDTMEGWVNKVRLAYLDLYRMMESPRTYAERLTQMLNSRMHSFDATGVEYVQDRPPIDIDGGDTLNWPDSISMSSGGNINGELLGRGELHFTLLSHSIIKRQYRGNIPKSEWNQVLKDQWSCAFRRMITPLDERWLQRMDADVNIIHPPGPKREQEKQRRIREYQDNQAPFWISNTMNFRDNVPEDMREFIMGFDQAQGGYGILFSEIQEQYILFPCTGHVFAFINFMTGIYNNAELIEKLTKIQIRGGAELFRQLAILSRLAKHNPRSVQTNIKINYIDWSNLLQNKNKPYKDFMENIFTFTRDEYGDYTTFYLDFAWGHIFFVNDLNQYIHKHIQMYLKSHKKRLREKQNYNIQPLIFQSQPSYYKKKHEEMSNHWIFWDLETTCGNGVVMQPYLISWMYINSWNSNVFIEKHPDPELLDVMEGEEDLLQRWVDEILMQKIIKKKREADKPVYHLCAFNGSKFDNIFIVKHILKHFQSYKRMGTATNMKIVEFENNDFIIKLVDAQLMSGSRSLSSFCKSMKTGQDKQDCDEILEVDSFVKWNTMLPHIRNKIIRYCQQDVYALAFAMIKFNEITRGMIETLDQIVCKDLKKEKNLLGKISDTSMSLLVLSPTWPATAFNIITKILLKNVLKPLEDDQVYTACSQSYFGGMTQVFDNNKHVAMEDERIVYVDFNSQYPAAMCANEYVSAVQNNLKQNKFIWCTNNANALQIQYQLNDYRLCVQPKKDIDAHSLYHITSFGLSEIWGAGCIPIRLVKEGLLCYPASYVIQRDTMCQPVWVWGSLLLFIVEMEEQFGNKTNTWFSSDCYYRGVGPSRMFKNLEQVYEMRRKEKDDAKKDNLKLLMNSAYGKFGQKEFEQHAFFNKDYFLSIQGQGQTHLTAMIESHITTSTKIDDQHGLHIKDIKLEDGLNTINIQLDQTLLKDTKITRLPSNNKARFVYIASQVTNFARIMLMRAMFSLRKVKECKRILYCDTDSLIFTLKGEQLHNWQQKYKDVLNLDDSQLGAFKVERLCSEFHAIAPKLYRYKTSTFPEQSQKFTYKMKGIQKCDEMIQEKLFENLVTDNKAHITQLQWQRLQGSIKQQNIQKEFRVFLKRNHHNQEQLFSSSPPQSAFELQKKYIEFSKIQ